MNANIKFLGAAGTVTGSRALVTVQEKSFLIDCGLFQGDKSMRLRNWEKFSPDPRSISAVVLTHAHLDHSGYLPKLVKEGFRGPIHCAKGTADLCRILLLDAAHLEEEAAKFANETGYSSHRPAKPLFTTSDAEAALKLFVAHDRDQWIELDNKVQVRFLRAGHIIGSSYVQLGISNSSYTRTVLFSGDVGHGRSLTLRPPVPFPTSDYMVLESTYGNRTHDRTDVCEAIAKIANDTFTRKGVLVIPAFAVGRAQELLFIFKKLEDAKLIPIVPVILDSPMARAATDVFLAHPEDHNLGLGIGDGAHELFPQKFECSTTPDESMLACMRDGPLVVISAAGMLTGGRILHHLKARLPHPENCILFAGYQAESTKGRFLQDNNGKVATLRIHHQEVDIEARIETVAQLSSHADYLDLAGMLLSMPQRPRCTILNHGAPEPTAAFADYLTKHVGLKTVMASSDNFVVEVK